MAASYGATDVPMHQHQQQFQYMQALPQQQVQYQQVLLGQPQHQHQQVLLGQPQHQHQQVLLGQPHFQGQYPGQYQFAQAPPNMQPPRENIYNTVTAAPSVYARPSAVAYTHPAKYVSRGVTPSVAHGTDFRVNKPEQPRVSALPGKPVREALPGSSAVPGLIQEMISPRASKRENSFYEELARESPFRSGPDSRTPRYETTLQGIYQVDEQSQQMMPVGDPISNLLQMPKSPTSSNSRNAPLSPSRSYGRTQSSPAFSHNGRTCSHTNEKDIARDNAADVTHGVNVLGELLDNLLNASRPRRKAEDAYHSNPRVNARLGSSASTYYENGDRDQGRTMPNPNQLNFFPMSAPGPYFSQIQQPGLTSPSLGKIPMPVQQAPGLMSPGLGVPMQAQKAPNYTGEPFATAGLTFVNPSTSGVMGPGVPSSRGLF